MEQQSLRINSFPTCKYFITPREKIIGSVMIVDPTIKRSRENFIERRRKSVNKILEHPDTKRKDPSSLCLDLMQKILLSLTVKEISELCRINKTFNNVCRRESFWKNKTLTDYGINKKYWDTDAKRPSTKCAMQSSACGATWRETAKNLSLMKMINLNKKWINGMTYRELIEESMKHHTKNPWEYDQIIHYSYLGCLRYRYMVKILGKDVKRHGAFDFNVIGNDDFDRYDFFESFGYMYVDQGDSVYDKMEQTLTREFSVIMLAIQFNDCANPPVGTPLLKEDYYDLLDKTQYSKAFKVLHDLIDIEYYVMQVSSLTNYTIFLMNGLIGNNEFPDYSITFETIPENKIEDSNLMSVECGEEPFWRDKVLTNYGIEKKYWNTWRETAKNLSILNMINLNKKWTPDEMTYRELIEQSMKHSSENKSGLITHDSYLKNFENQEILTREFLIIVLAISMYDNNSNCIMGAPLMTDYHFCDVESSGDKYTTEFNILNELIGIEYYIMQLSPLTDSDIDVLMNIKKFTH